MCRLQRFQLTLILSKFAAHDVPLTSFEAEVSGNRLSLCFTHLYDVGAGRVIRILVPA